jgi:hypothetical protein
MYKKENIWILNALFVCVCVCKKNINTTRKLKKKNNKITNKKYFVVIYRHKISDGNCNWIKKIPLQIPSVFLTCQIGNKITDRMLIGDLERN